MDTPATSTMDPDAPPSPANPAPPPAPSRKPGIIVPHRATWIQRVAARLIHLALRSIAMTIRFRWERPPGEVLPEPGPYIFATWHNRLPLCLDMYRIYAKATGRPFRIVGIVSASRDGALMARVLELNGVQPVRGSSSRRGAQALVEMSGWIERGYDVSATCDGPRGPRYGLKPGAVALAQLSGRPLVPASYHLNWKITLKTWDGFQIPLPFATCRVFPGRPIHVPRRLSEAEREAFRVQAETQLRELTVD